MIQHRIHCRDSLREVPDWCNHDPRLRILRRADRLRLAPPVVADEPLGVFHDVGRRPVVHAQLVSGEVTAQKPVGPQDVLRRRTPPLKYGLVVVSGYREGGAAPVSDRPDQTEIQRVNVLELVHEDVGVGCRAR